MPNEREPDPLVGQTLGSKYRVRRLIGTGGMGVVYEVEHLLTKRVGALKLLRGSFAAFAPAAERFVREASAAGRIGNPHIVETYDAGELPSGEPYIFMELLSGHPVTELVRRDGGLSIDEALEIVIQATEGLAAAHAAHIVHRDIKPDNLFLCRGEKPFVKILDFGISKFAAEHADHRLTAEGATLGTPYYMSPEQVVGKRDLDQRTDVYSLAVVLYECVTGRVPFHADSLPALGVKIFDGQYTPVTELVPSAPRALDAIIARAMAAKSERRYPDMTSFRDALIELRGVRQVAPARIHSKRRWLSAVVLLAAVLGAVAAVIFTGRRSDGPERASTAPSALVTPVAGTSVSGAIGFAAPAPHTTADVAPAPARSTPGATPASASRAAKPRGAQKPTAVSPAAKDGLSETNPFAN